MKDSFDVLAYVHPFDGDGGTLHRRCIWTCGTVIREKERKTEEHVEESE